MSLRAQTNKALCVSEPCLYKVNILESPGRVARLQGYFCVGLSGGGASLWVIVDNVQAACPAIVELTLRGR